MRKSLALSVIVALAMAATALAGTEARMTGKVTDGATKEPIAGVLITLESIEGKNVKLDVKTKEDGSYAIFVLDGTIRYKFTYAKEGYVPYIEIVKMQLGPTQVKDVEMLTGKAAAAIEAAKVPDKVDPSVEAYNAGAALANADDLAGAIAKFEEAVAAKPDLIAGWIALAKTSYRTKDYKRAIEAANKVVEIDDSDGEMWSVLHASYTATGDKAKAAEAEKKMPQNAPGLFNEAARQINAGNDADAEKLLKQAIAIDEKFGQAYYELGMLLVRSGKNAEAKDALLKYVEIDPSGRDVATAKEMLKYLQ